MARDEGLEELLREDLAAETGLSEKSMFGGRAWLVHGNLVCGARDDGMLVRLGKGNDGWALGLADVKPMMMQGKRMEGWVRAGAAAFGDDEVRARLLAGALKFVKGLQGK